MSVKIFDPQNGITSHEQWLELRRSGLGASEAAAVIGQSPWLDNVELWRRKTGRSAAPDISNNEAVAYGHEAEAPIRELFALDYADRYETSYGGAFDLLRHPEYPFLFCTLDGRLQEIGTGRKGVLEIKTTSIVRSMQKEKWWGPDGPCLPQQYYSQLVHQLLVTGFDFAVLHGQLKYNYGDDIRSERRTYFIEREEVKDDIEYLLEQEIEFWNEYVLEDKEPPLILPSI